MRRRVFLGGVAAGIVAVATGCSSSENAENSGAAAAPAPLRLLFLGDSITNGSAASNFAFSYGPLTLGMLGGVAVRPDSLIGGYPGAPSSFILDKLREYRSQNPDLVVILAGLNDFTQGVPLSTTKSNLLQAVQEAGAERCVVGTPPVPLGATPAEMQSLDELNSWLVDERGLPAPVTIVDFNAALRTPNSVESDPRVRDADGVHPNGLGHQVMARTLVGSLTGSRGRLKATGLVEQADIRNRFGDPFNAALEPTDVWNVVDTGPSILTGARFVDSSSEFLRGGRWLELECATGPAAGSVQLASVTSDVSDARGRRVVLCCQCEVEVVSGSWLEDVSSGASELSLALTDGSGQFVPQSSPFLGNAGYVSETDPRVVRWGPVAYPVALDPPSAGVSISVAVTLAANSRVLARVGCLGLYFEDELPGSFRVGPSSQVDKLA